MIKKHLISFEMGVCWQQSNNKEEMEKLLTKKTPKDHGSIRYSMINLNYNRQNLGCF